MRDGNIVAKAHTGRDKGDDSLYGIGSVSKSFVAAIALILEQAGILSLDDTIGQYCRRSISGTGTG